MSRRSSPTKREILPDPVYNSVTITKFINVLMERGKKEGKDGKKKRSGPSEVELLASEPQWDEEMYRLVKQVTEMQGTACNMR